MNTPPAGAQRGCDLSQYSGPVDFNKMKAAGYTWVKIRASWGCNVDPMYETLKAGAKAAGMPWGAFHFGDWRWPFPTQRDFFINLIQGDPGELEPDLDLEMDPTPKAYNATTHNAIDLMPETRKLIGSSTIPDKYLSMKMKEYSLSPFTVQGRVWDFLLTVASKVGSAGLYTGFYYWTQWGTPVSQWEQFPLWLPWYSLTIPIKIPAPWKSYKYWQDGCQGNGPEAGQTGLSLDTDWGCINIPAPIPGPAPVQPTPVSTTYVVIPLVINVRQQPSSSSKWMGWLYKGNKIQVLNIADGWAQLQNGTYVYANYIQPV